MQTVGLNPTFIPTEITMQLGYCLDLLTSVTRKLQLKSIANIARFCIYWLVIHENVGQKLNASQITNISAFVGANGD